MWEMIVNRSRYIYVWPKLFYDQYAPHIWLCGCGCGGRKGKEIECIFQQRMLCKVHMSINKTIPFGIAFEPLLLCILHSTSHDMPAQRAHTLRRCYFSVRSMKICIIYCSICNICHLKFKSFDGELKAKGLVQYWMTLHNVVGGVHVWEPEPQAQAH